jgi:hypothetical protein
MIRRVQTKRVPLSRRDRFNWIIFGGQVEENKG